MEATFWKRTYILPAIVFKYLPKISAKLNIMKSNNNLKAIVKFCFEQLHKYVIFPHSSVVKKKLKASTIESFYGFRV